MKLKKWTALLLTLVLTVMAVAALGDETAEPVSTEFEMPPVADVPVNDAADTSAEEPAGPDNDVAVNDIVADKLPEHRLPEKPDAYKIVDEKEHIAVFICLDCEEKILMPAKEHDFNDDGVCSDCGFDPSRPVSEAERFDPAEYTPVVVEVQPSPTPIPSPAPVCAHINVHTESFRHDDNFDRIRTVCADCDEVLADNFVPHSYVDTENGSACALCGQPAPETSEGSDTIGTETEAQPTPAPTPAPETCAHPAEALYESACSPLDEARCVSRTVCGACGAVVARNEHEHTFEETGLSFRDDATHTRALCCTLCGATATVYEAHDFAEGGACIACGYVRENPECAHDSVSADNWHDEDGLCVRRHGCNICGALISVEELEHDFSGYKYNYIDADTHDRTAVCHRCGTESVLLFPHTYDANGYCAVCNSRRPAASIESAEEFETVEIVTTSFRAIAPLPVANKSVEPAPCAVHSPVVDAAVPATCEATGLSEGSHCAVCGAILVAQELVLAKGHEPVSRGDTPATCEKGGTIGALVCSVCGKTVQEAQSTMPLGHDYKGSWSSDAKNHYHECTRCGAKRDSAAHSSAGPATEDAAEVCSICNYTINPPVGHDHSTHLKPVAEKPADCTSAGNIAYYSCSCGMLFADAAAQTAIKSLSETVIPAKGHTPVTDAAIEPDCVNPGKTEGSHCDVCKTVLKEQQSLPPKGHVSSSLPTVAPGCTTTGLTEGSVCDVCRTVLLPQQVVPAAGHRAVTDAEVAPTCTEPGLSQGSHCEICKEILTPQQTIPATGHSAAVDEAVAPTCTKSGLTEGSHCEVCGEILTAQETVPATGHSYAESYSSNDKYHWHTCTICGVTDKASKAKHTPVDQGGKKVCSVCGYVISPEKGHVHSLTPVSGSDPDCTTTGIKAYQKCDCGQWFWDSAAKNLIKNHDDVIIPANGHSVAIDEAVAPTCTEAGKTRGTHCSVCHLVLTAQQTVEALGHIEVVDPAIEASCAKTGLTEGSHCYRCSETLVVQETTDKKDHSPVTDAAVEPSCRSTGLSEGSHCTACGEILTPQTVVARTGHTSVTDAGRAATCSRTGLTDGAHCSVCGTVLTTQTVIDKLPHTPVTDAGKEATCTEKGISEGSHCSVCGTVIKAQKTLKALGHSWGAWEIIKEATEDEEGSKKHSCSRCGKVSTITIPKIGAEEEVTYKVGSGILTENTKKLKYDLTYPEVGEDETPYALFCPRERLSREDEVCELELKLSVNTLKAFKQKSIGSIVLRGLDARAEIILPVDETLTMVEDNEASCLQIRLEERPKVEYPVDEDYYSVFFEAVRVTAETIEDKEPFEADPDEFQITIRMNCTLDAEEGYTAALYTDEVGYAMELEPESIMSDDMDILYWETPYSGAGWYALADCLSDLEEF